MFVYAQIEERSSFINQWHMIGPYTLGMNMHTVNHEIHACT